MDTDREMDIRIVEILTAHDELERTLVLGQLGSRAKRMMQNGEGDRVQSDEGAENPAAPGAEAPDGSYVGGV